MISVSKQETAEEGKTGDFERLRTINQVRQIEVVDVVADDDIRINLKIIPENFYETAPRCFH